MVTRRRGLARLRGRQAKPGGLYGRGLQDSDRRSTARFLPCYDDIVINRAGGDGGSNVTRSVGACRGAGVGQGMCHLPGPQASGSTPLRPLQSGAQEGAARDRLGTDSGALARCSGRGSAQAPQEGARDRAPDETSAPVVDRPGAVHRGHRNRRDCRPCIARGKTYAGIPRGHHASTNPPFGAGTVGRARQHTHRRRKGARRSGASPRESACSGRRAHFPSCAKASGRRATGDQRSASGPLRKYRVAGDGCCAAESGGSLTGEGSACAGSVAGHGGPDRALRARRFFCQRHVRAARAHQVLRRLLGSGRAVSERYPQRSRPLIVEPAKPGFERIEIRRKPMDVVVPGAVDQHELDGRADESSQALAVG